MNTAHACAFAEYVEAWTALQGRPVEWLLSAEGDRAHDKATLGVDAYGAHNPAATVDA